MSDYSEREFLEGLRYEDKFPDDDVAEVERLREVEAIAAKCRYFLADGSMRLPNHVAIWMRELLAALDATTPTDSTTEVERLRGALDRIQEKRRRQSDTWQPSDLPGYGRGWRDGYVTAMAECSLIATEATDPEGWAEHQDEWRAATRENDREWFERTGCCGHCGNPAEDCLCTDDDPCDCGPHEGRRTWPRDCGWCKGTGKVEPIARRALSPSTNDTEARDGE